MLWQLLLSVRGPTQSPAHHHLDGVGRGLCTPSSDWGAMGSDWGVSDSWWLLGKGEAGVFLREWSLVGWPCPSNPHQGCVSRHKADWSYFRTKDMKLVGEGRQGIDLGGVRRKYWGNVIKTYCICVQEVTKEFPNFTLCLTMCRPLCRLCLCGQIIWNKQLNVFAIGWRSSAKGCGGKRFEFRKIATTRYGQT